MPEKIKSIAIIGDGGWGTTLAIHLHHKGYSVKIWGPFPDYIQELNKTRENKKYLPGIKIPAAIRITDDLRDVLKDSQLIVLAIPSQFVRKVLKLLKKFDLSKKILLSAVKGVEEKSLRRISDIISEELGRITLAVLSGPTIAYEVAHRIPTTAVIASKNKKTAGDLQKVFNSKTFRIYTNSDVAGVELGGSIKNVIAIACGVCDGLGFGSNAKAAILTRGLAEMTRLAIAMGAKKTTLFGLSGLGDLATTAFSPKSRNRFVGEELGKGKTIQHITGNMSMIAEGVTTAKAIYQLSKKHQIPMPITTEVYNIIYRGKKPQKAVLDLMQRKTKSE